jgi:Arc/MetJ-type ribon-helix-helix transcriptional regulator
MPSEMYEHLLCRLSKTRYASVSEYVRELIRKDDPDQGEPGQLKAPTARSRPERELPFIIKTANEWLQEGLEEHRGSG